IAANTSSPPLVTPTRSFQSIPRTLSSQDLPGSPTHSKALRSPPTNRIAFSSPESSHSPANSSQSSSPSSSAPNSPAGVPSSTTVHYQRPSTLHGLKHKLHSAAKSIHSPNRRKSVGHIPLSPLARTPSPSPLPSSPTRSPSPLAFPAGHHPGSSNTTQSYSPGTSLSTPGSGNKKGFGRPKSAEPGSPLLRRALSPDRLHPRSAESKTKPTSSSISPLCNPAPKVTISTAPRVTITSQSPPIPTRPTAAEYGSSSTQIITTKPPEHPLLARPARDIPGEKSMSYPERREKKLADTHSRNSPEEDELVNNSDFIKLDHRSSVNVSVIVPCDRTSQHLPRIAEEKDSPTGSKEEAMLAGTKEQEGNLTKDTESGLKKAKNDKSDSQIQKLKGNEVKAIQEERCTGSNKVETKTRRKDGNDSSVSKVEAKSSKPSVSEKDGKPKYLEQSGGTGKTCAQEKRELYRVSSSKE
ncbi:hypothetical protein L9F63_011675, partial [Diploptera punctata]